MSGILGALGIEEAAAERTFISTLGQELVYTAVQAEIAKYNDELNAVLGLFVERRTSNFKQRYELPGGGYLQKMSTKGKPDNVKATGYWDVAFPLEDFGAGLTVDRVSRAYMTAAQLNKHLDTIFIQDKNTVRLEILKALMYSSTWTFTDEIHGSLSVMPLANGDSVVYPPVLGASAEAADNHYLESGYAAASISDTNDPTVTIKDELEEHFGTPNGGSNIVILTTKAIADYLEGLTDFDPVISRYIMPGANADIPIGLPAGVPGRVRGVCNSCWIVEWRAIPTNYSIGIHADAPKPLIMREDPSDTGLPSGLTLVAEDEDYPFKSSFYSHRFGLGVGNRLNGVVMEMGTGGSYTVPTGYGRV